MGTIHAKLSTVQTEIKCAKGQTNSFGGYRYRSCEDICEAIKPHLRTHGLVLNIADDIVMIGDRYYVKATATLIDAETGDHVCATGMAREEDAKKGMDASQITGTASSYARKYALNGLLALDDTKDADTNAYTKTTTVRCDECKAEITGYADKYGKCSAEDVAGYTRMRYGRHLCSACAQAARAAKAPKAAEAADATDDKEGT